MRSTLFTAGRYSYSYNSSIACTGTYRILHGLSKDPGPFSRLFHVYTYICRYGPMPILIGRRDARWGQLRFCLIAGNRCRGTYQGTNCALE